MHLKTPGGCAGQRFNLGTNKEVFGAEVYAIYRALDIVDQKQENRHRYTISVDSASAIERIRTDSIRPGQRFAAATTEVCTRIQAREDKATIC